MLQTGCVQSVSPRQTNDTVVYGPCWLVIKKVILVCDNQIYDCIPADVSIVLKINLKTYGFQLDWQ